MLTAFLMLLEWVWLRFCLSLIPTLITTWLGVSWGLDDGEQIWEWKSHVFAPEKEWTSMEFTDFGLCVILLRLLSPMITTCDVTLGVFQLAGSVFFWWIPCDVDGSRAC